MREKETPKNTAEFSLNPCCNGIYSMREQDLLEAIRNYVLILVVMEYTQWAMDSRWNKIAAKS